jgi:hypothetical protein
VARRIFDTLIQPISERQIKRLRENCTVLEGAHTRSLYTGLHLPSAHFNPLTLTSCSRRPASLALPARRRRAWRPALGCNDDPSAQLRHPP